MSWHRPSGSSGKRSYTQPSGASPSRSRPDDTQSSGFFSQDVPMSPRPTQGQPRQPQPGFEPIYVQRVHRGTAFGDGMPAPDYTPRPNPPSGPVLTADHVPVMVGSRLVQKHQAVAGPLQLFPSFQTAKFKHPFRNYLEENRDVIATTQFNREDFMTPVTKQQVVQNKLLRPSNPDEYYFDAPFKSGSTEFALPHVRFFEVNLDSNQPRQEQFGMVVGFPMLFRNVPISEAEFKQGFPMQLRSREDLHGDDYRRSVLVSDRAVRVMQGSRVDRLDVASRHMHTWKEGYGDRLRKLSFKTELAPQVLDLLTAGDRILNAGFFFVFMSTDGSGPVSPPDCFNIISRGVWHDKYAMECLEAILKFLQTKFAYYIRDMKTRNVGKFNNTGNTRPVNTVFTPEDMAAMERPLDEGRATWDVPNSAPQVPTFDGRPLGPDETYWPRLPDDVRRAILEHVHDFHAHSDASITSRLMEAVTRSYYYRHPRDWASHIDAVVNFADTREGRVRVNGLPFDDILSSMYHAKNLHRFRKERAPNLKNVAVHLTQRDFAARGEPFDLHLHEDVWKARLQELHSDPDAATAGRESLQAKKETNNHQVRVSRKGREVDHTSTAAAFQKEVHAFNIRTGGHIFGFTVKGRSLDYGTPQFFGTEMGEAFVRQLVGKSGQDLARDFEIFITQGSRGVANRWLLRKNDVKSSVRKMLLQSLRTATGDDNATMQYARFGRHIEDTYSVTLDGWPTPELINPSCLGTADLNALHAALLEGTCLFRRMTTDEKARRAGERAKELEKERAKRLQRKAALASLDGDDMEVEALCAPATLQNVASVRALQDLPINTLVLPDGARAQAFDERADLEFSQLSGNFLMAPQEAW
ncbi:hypothetical protein CALCODRAFT_508026 [Calocera cornea HHB12733]|uniref:Uncharacterized protein n=1 Tax=Calocera cornea HHB12733 TaxID=1353952 RepID=A0A165H0Y1_9BASI|nr:hypothetical protein CALCODRAFT_508026 [Calocera cornea HHB12733]